MSTDLEKKHLMAKKAGSQRRKSLAELPRSTTIWDNLHKETTFFNDMREFAGETSAHGVKYIFESPRKIMKAMFLVLWTSLTLYAVFTICTKILVYMNKPTGTKFEVVVDANVDERNQGIKFPTISVCSVNKVKKSYLDAEENKMIKEYFDIVDTYDTSLLENLIERFDDPDDEMSSIRNRTYESLLEDGGPNPNRFTMCQQTKQYCEQLDEFKENPYPQHFSMENSNTGKCWRVNPKGMLNGKMGDYGAMKLSFWADVQDYSDRAADTENHGFIVAFHDNETYGSTMFSGYLMSPGTFYKVDLRLKKITRNKDKIESCNASLTETTYGIYSEGACVAECKDKSMFEKCGCVQVEPPENNSKYKSCTLETWVRCGLPHYREWYANYSNTKLAKAICHCDIPCEETKYEADLSSSSLSPAFARTLHRSVGAIMSNPAYGFSNPEFNISYNSPQDVLENLMVMEILFTSMQKYEVNEVITYDLGNLFGDVGGVLGLFLGASFFTILEFLLFLSVSVAKYCCKATGWGDRAD